MSRIIPTLEILYLPILKQWQISFTLPLVGLNKINRIFPIQKKHQLTKYIKPDQTELKVLSGNQKSIYNSSDIDLCLTNIKSDMILPIQKKHQLIKQNERATNTISVIFRKPIINRRTDRQPNNIIALPRWVYSKIMLFPLN